MIAAIAEITAMLIGALLIGIFITWQYWKRKYQENDHNHLKMIHSKEQQIISQQKEERKLKNTVDEISNQLEGQRVENKNLKSEIEHTKSTNSVLTEEIEVMKEELNVVKDENAKLKSDLKDVKEKTERKKADIKSKTVKTPEPKLESKSRNKSKTNKQTKTMDEHSYYRTIEGKKYKDKPLQMAEEAIAGQGDGRISKADAEQIFATISDGHQYTDVEKNTMKYLRDNFRWTPEADELFRHEVRVWAAKGHKLD